MKIKCKRRQCFVLGESLTFMNAQANIQKVSDKYYSAAQKSSHEGIKMLENFTEQFLQERERIKKQGKQVEVKDVLSNMKSKMPEKKQLIEQEPSMIEKTNEKRFFSFNKEGNENECSIAKPQSKKKRLTEVDKLTLSLEKLGYKDDFLGGPDDEEEVNENFDYENIEHLKNKSLGQLISESNRKVTEKLANRQHFGQRDNDLEEFESDGSYPMTDYSSNQSSNQDDYDEKFCQELPKMPIKYETVSNITIPTHTSINTSQKFQASKLMFSPKKQTGKKRRLYQNKKRIPRWAEDIDTVNQQTQKQRKDPDFDPEKIYGICIVERLDTNIIFNCNEFYTRGSSARWNRYPYIQKLQK